MNYDLAALVTPGSGVRKAAVLILTLGDELAREVFNRLSEAEIRTLGEVAAQLDDVQDREIIEVLTEFKEAYHGGMIPSAGAGNLFKLMVENALGEERASSLLNSNRPDDPFEVCANIDAKILARVLKNEHPQTTAIVLASIDPEKAGQILEALDTDLAGQIIYRLGHLGNISDDVRSDIGNTLISELEAMGTLDGGDPIDPEKLAVDVTKALPPEYSDQVLDAIAESDDEFAQQVRSKLFIFDDLGKLDTRTMQRLLREVDSKRLMIALKGATDSLKELVFSSMSSRAAEMLREDMEASPPVRIAEAEEAQEDILQVAFQLESEGAIALPRGDSSGMV